MNAACYYARLVATAARIAHHASFPGKGEAIEQCLEDIDDLAHAGRITAEQRDLLRGVLRGSLSHAA